MTTLKTVLIGAAVVGAGFFLWTRYLAPKSVGQNVGSIVDAATNIGKSIATRLAPQTMLPPSSPFTTALPPQGPTTTQPATQMLVMAPSNYQNAAQRQMLGATPGTMMDPRKSLR